jgi:phage-related protein
VARQIVVDLVSDAADFEREMRRAASAAENLEEAIEDAAESGDALGRASGKMAEAMDGASTQLTGVNDLVMGFSDVTGIALPPQAEMIMGFADMAGGLAVLLPNLAKAKTVMQAVNAVMRANPILTVVTVLALLTAAFVVAYKKSETFRNIVHGCSTGSRRPRVCSWTR